MSIVLALLGLSRILFNDKSFFSCLLKKNVFIELAQLASSIGVNLN